MTALLLQPEKKIKIVAQVQLDRARGARPGRRAAEPLRGPPGPRSARSLLAKLPNEIRNIWLHQYIL